MVYNGFTKQAKEETLVEGENENKDVKLTDSQVNAAAAYLSEETFFTGRYAHSVDDKYRIKIPAEARSLINGPFRLGVAADKAIAVYPKDKALKRLASLTARKQAVSSNPDLSVEDKKKAIYSLSMLISLFTQDIEEDSQGRFVLPQALMNWANITKKCAVYTVGVGGHFEIWNAASYDAKFNEEDYMKGLDIAGVFDLDSD